MAPHGWALKLDPWLLEQWTAMAGKEFVDNGNGRDARATEVTFDNDEGLSVFQWMSDMVDSGLAENTGPAEGNINHYLAVGNKTSAMTADTSAALGTVLSVLGSGQFPGVDLGVAPLPGLPGDGATFVGGGANYIVKGDDPGQGRSRVAVRQVPRRAQPQAKWAQTGYIPIRQSAIDTPEVQQLWTTPAVLQGRLRPARRRQHDRGREGPVIGDFAGVRKAETDAMEQMMTNGVSPADALAEARRTVERSDQRLQRAGRLAGREALREREELHVLRVVLTNPLTQRRGSFPGVLADVHVGAVGDAEAESCLDLDVRSPPAAR